MCLYAFSEVLLQQSFRTAFFEERLFVGLGEKG